MKRLKKIITMIADKNQKEKHKNRPLHARNDGTWESGYRDKEAQDLAVLCDEILDKIVWIEKNPELYYEQHILSA